MINNIAMNVDTGAMRGVNKSVTSRISNPMPPIIGFKTPLFKQKATLRVKRFKRSDNILLAGDIDDDYVDIIEEEIQDSSPQNGSANFFASPQKQIQTYKALKECFVIDYIQSPKARNGLGTEALKSLAEKAMFDPKIQGRIVTFSTPLCPESSPAIFFYKMGFRFLDPNGNSYIEDCMRKNIPDIPPQTGMMYLPKHNLHKLLRYGDLF